MTTDEATSATLITLQVKIQETKQTFQTIFSGGARGLLGLVCSANKVYGALIPNVDTYVCPNNRVALNITADGLTQYQLLLKKPEINMLV